MSIFVKVNLKWEKSNEFEGCKIDFKICASQLKKISQLSFLLALNQSCGCSCCESRMCKKRVSKQGGGLKPKSRLGKTSFKDCA